MSGFPLGEGNSPDGRTCITEDKCMVLDAPWKLFAVNGPQNIPHMDCLLELDPLLDFGSERDRKRKIK